MNDSPLTFLEPTFYAAYARALRDFSDRPFLSWYGIRGEIKRVSLAEFHADVANSIAHIQTCIRLEPHIESVVTIGGNTYLHLCYIVASWLAGLTLCPLNPEEGATRLASKIANLNSSALVFVDPKAIDIAGDIGIPMRQPLPREKRAPDVPLGPSNTLEGTAFPADRPMVFIYTSGSTGYSKIVEQMEDSIIRNVDALIERHRMSEGRRIATPLPVFHVNALEFSFLSALLSGSHLTLFERFSAPQVYEVLSSEQCEILSLVPTLLRALVGRSDLRNLHDLSNLKYIVSAAAPLNVQLVEAAFRYLGVPVIQGYGLSEAVNFSCLLPVNLGKSEYLRWMTSHQWPSIGTALRDNEVFVINEEGEVLGENQSGEVCIRGAYVMRGYRGDIERSVLANGYLHTGDLGHFKLDDRSERYFFITGRKKETLKRNGQTIALQEIDDVLSRFTEPGFDAIAIPFANQWSGEEVGIAANCSTTWNEELEKRFSQHLDQMLPNLLRPKLMVLTNLVLRTASGKPQRWPLISLFLPYKAANIGQSLRVIYSPS